VRVGTEHRLIMVLTLVVGVASFLPATRTLAYPSSLRAPVPLRSTPASVRLLLPGGGGSFGGGGQGNFGGMGQGNFGGAGQGRFGGVGQGGFSGMGQGSFGGGGPGNFGGGGPEDFGIDMQRKESAKVCAIAVVSGCLASVPAMGASHAINEIVVSSDQWVFSLGMLAVELALFGAVYRCTVRGDDNSMLRDGAVGAFALCRALASLTVSSVWTTELTVQLLTTFGEGIVAFGCAMRAIEFAWDRGWARPLEGHCPDLGPRRPTYYGGYDQYGTGGYGQNAGGFQSGGFNQGGGYNPSGNNFNQNGNFNQNQNSNFNQNGFGRAGPGQNNGPGAPGGPAPPGGPGGPGGQQSYEDYMRSRSPGGGGLSRGVVSPTGGQNFGGSAPGFGSGGQQNFGGAQQGYGGSGQGQSFGGGGGGGSGQGNGGRSSGGGQSYEDYMRGRRQS